MASGGGTNSRFGSITSKTITFDGRVKKIIIVGSNGSSASFSLVYDKESDETHFKRMQYGTSVQAPASLTFGEYEYGIRSIQYANGQTTIQIDYLLTLSTGYYCAEVE